MNAFWVSPAEDVAETHSGSSAALAGLFFLGDIVSNFILALHRFKRQFWGDHTRQVSQLKKKIDLLAHVGIQEENMGEGGTVAYKLPTLGQVMMNRRFEKARRRGCGSMLYRVQVMLRGRIITVCDGAS